MCENALLLHSAMEILELVSGTSHTATNKVTYFKLKSQQNYWFLFVCFHFGITDFFVVVVVFGRDVNYDRVTPEHVSRRWSMARLGLLCIRSRVHRDYLRKHPGTGQRHQADRYLICVLPPACLIPRGLRAALNRQLPITARWTLTREFSLTLSHGWFWW